jgi:hypothetical protein
MTLYEKDKSFAPGWIIGGAILMLIAQIFAGLVLAIFGVTNLWIIVGVVAAIYFIVGFGIGWKSEGQTIIEPALAAILSVGVGVGINFLRTGHMPSPVAITIANTPPFLLALVGAFIGEKVQGDSVEVQD